jgi:hypothetical protein
MPQGSAVSGPSVTPDSTGVHNAAIGASSNGTNIGTNSMIPLPPLQQLQDHGAPVTPVLSNYMPMSIPFILPFMAQMQVFSQTLPGSSTSTMGNPYSPITNLTPQVHEEFLLHALVQANLNNENYKQALVAIRGVSKSIYLLKAIPTYFFLHR